jgi:hypothetical protein
MDQVSFTMTQELAMTSRQLQPFVSRRWVPWRPALMEGFVPLLLIADRLALEVDQERSRQHRLWTLNAQIEACCTLHLDG